MRTLSVAAVTPEAIGLPHVQSVISAHRHSENVRSGEATSGERWYVSSLSVEEIGNGKQLAEHIRNHWSIENSNHWHRDANWKEDKSRCRTPALARMLGLLRGPALSLARRTGQPMPELFLACTRSPAKALKLITSRRQI